MATEAEEETPDFRPSSDGRSRRKAIARRLAGAGGGFAALAVFGLAGVAWAYHLLDRSAPDIDAIWAQAEADFMAGRLDRVETALGRLGRLRTASPLDHMLRGQYAAARDKPDQALTELDLVPDGHFIAAQARLLAGQIELRRNRLRYAEDLFQAALRLNPKVIQAHRELIYIFGMQLRRRESSSQFLALSGLVPLSFENVFNWCLLRTNRWEPGEASAILARCVSADPLDRWSRLALAENQRRMGQHDAAESVLESLGRDDSAAIAARARIAIDRQNEDRAEQLLAACASNDAELALLRGRLALAHRDAGAAWRHFRIAFGAQPDDHEAVFGLVRALELAGRPDAAGPLREIAKKLERLTTLIDSAARPAAAKDAALLRELGAACADLHRDAEARAWYQLALLLDPMNGEVQRAIYHLNDPIRAARAVDPVLPESISSIETK